MSETGKTYSKFQWFFLVICIPVVFAIILIGVILSLLGISVIDKAKEYSSNIPVVATLLEAETEDEIVEEVDVDLLYVTIEELQSELKRLQQTIDERDEALAMLQNEQAQAEHQASLEEERYQEQAQELKDIAKTYEAMSAKNAAAIISQLTIEDALLHLSQISVDVRAAILAKMDSELAADLMTRLSNQ